MSEFDLILRNVRPFGGALTNIGIASGKILQISPALTGASDFDGQGRDIIPGLADHHIHLFATAARLDSADLANCQSENDIATALRAAAASKPPNNWLRAIGLTEPKGVVPDRALLDQWIADRPLRIQDRTGALWLLNSMAIERLGTGPWPECVELAGTGVPTGRIWRGDAWLRSITQQRPPTLAQLSAQLSSLGVTHVTDTGAQNGPEEAALFEAAVQSGELKQRLTLMGREDLPESALYMRGPLKLLYDEHNLPEIGQVATRIGGARAQGRNVAAHCVTAGELLFFLAALDASGGTKAGDRIEHGAMIAADLIADIAAAGLAVVPQPGFVRTRGDRYLVEIPDYELPDLCRLGSLHHAGIRVMGGSDAPYGPFDPWLAIEAACKRNTATGQKLNEQEALSFNDALGMFLSTPAITAGMPANLCLLHSSIEEVARGDGSNPIAATFINGELVFTT